jgi:hypothetical protein
MGKGAVVVDDPGRSASAEYRRARAAARRWTVASVVCGGMAAAGLVVAGRRGLPWIAVLIAGVALVTYALRPEPDADRWRRGAAGEMATAGLLERLPRRFVVFHDRAIPGSRANIDHLVVGPTGVWVIDTKTRSGRRRWRIDVGPVTYEASRVGALLGVETVPLVVVHGNGVRLRRRGRVIEGVRVLPAWRMLRWLRRGAKVLNRGEIGELVERADELFPPAV